MPDKVTENTAPESICIFRLSALGDVTHVLPIIHTLQAYWPNTKITWIIGAFEHKLVGKLPGVEFIIFNKKQGVRAIWELRRQLKGRHFDIFLHMQVALRANIASLFVKAHRKIGYDRQRSRDLHGLFVKERIAARNEQHVVDGFFEFLRKAGLEQKKMCWDLPESPSDSEFANAHILPGKKVAVISPCSSHQLRNWSAKNYAAVADYLVSKHGCQVLICGGPSDIEYQMADAIQQNMQTEAINLVGRDTLPEFVRLLQRADVLVSPDSGPAHIATCVDTAVVGLYAATNPRRSGPYKSVQSCVDKFDDACLQFLGKPKQEVPWGSKIETAGVMELISVGDVCDKLDAVLLDSRSSRVIPGTA